MHAANDDEIFTSTEEAIKLLGPMPPCVNAATYDHIDSDCIIYGMEKFAKEHNIKSPDVPVIMRGSFERMAWQQPYYIFRDAVIGRYIKLYKLTILSDRDARILYRKLSDLMSSKPKRRVYFRTTNQLSAQTFYNEHGGSGVAKCYINGECYWYLGMDKIAVIKSIKRHLKKLSNYHQGEGQWQRLIRQAI